MEETFLEKIRRLGNDPGQHLSALFAEAADEIERLRRELENAKRLAGDVTTGPSFAKIKQTATQGGSE